jgi:hypothetical protein
MGKMMLINESEVLDQPKICPYVLVKSALGPRMAQGWLRNRQSINQDDCLTLNETLERGGESKESLQSVDQSLYLVSEHLINNPILNTIMGVSKCDILIENVKICEVIRQPAIIDIEPFDVVIENEPLLRKTKTKKEEPSGPLTTEDRKMIFYLIGLLHGNIIENYEEETRRYRLNFNDAYRG